MINTAELLMSLWGVFRSEIGTGEPVFFCFSQETLKDHLSSSLLAGRSPLDVICVAARTCYDIYNHDVLLRPDALTSRGKNGFSMAIVLVCQQVLAVEEMVRDGSRYSENAYFPRLRSLVSPQLEQLSQNPFGFYEFESIWKTFAREIRRIPGSTDDTVTFEFGSYSGINKARLFPLSQALLSRADLIELVARCRLDRLRNGSAKDVWIEVRRERVHLSRRGQRLVNSGFLRDRLIEQVQNYARRVSITPLSSRESVQRIELELAICLDVADWVNEEYGAFLIAKGGAQHVNAEPQIRAAIASALGERGYAFCALGEFGDYWSYSETARQVGPGETVVLLGTGIGIELARTILGSLSPPVPLDESRLKALGLASGVHVCQVTLPMDHDDGVTIRGGRILGDIHRASASGYEWIGGVCLDRRARKYLQEALPAAIRFGASEFRMDEVNRAGDSPISWTRLRRAIDKLEADASYELRFGASNLASLSIAVADKTQVADAMGFLIDSDGLLSPTLERIGDHDAGVIGFFQRGIDVAKAASVGAIAVLLRDLKSGGGRLLTTQEMQDVLARISVSTIPRNVKTTIVGLLKRQPKVRDSVLVEFLAT